VDNSIEAGAFLRSRATTPSLRTNVARALNVAIFYALPLVTLVIAVPYGGAQPWWQAVFECLVFLLAAIAVVERWLGADAAPAMPMVASLRHGAGRLLLPLVALIVFALIQLIPSGRNIAGVNVQWTLSSDPLGTKSFIVELCALIAFAWLLVRYTVTERRLFFFIDVIIAVAFLSALFGLLRQATQHQTGFMLSGLKPGFGYAQFINTNHFAYLMEMAAGLALGVAVSRGVGPRRLVIFPVAAAVMWLAVVRGNSRGGIVSLLCQVVLLGVFALSARHSKNVAPQQASIIKRWAATVALIAVLLVGSIAAVIFVGGDPLASRIDTLSVELNQQTAQTYTLRQNIWQATWALIKDHPIAGVGFGGYWVAIAQYHRASGETTPQQAHNDYLELMASGGIVAVAIAVWFALIFANVARRAVNQEKRSGAAVAVGAVVGISTVAIHSLVDFGLHVPINAMVFAALIALVIIVENQSRRPAQSTS
jgi:O-antigen ligase